VDKSLPILNEKFNKNYRLPLQKSYEGRILQNHNFKEERVLGGNKKPANSKERKSEEETSLSPEAIQSLRLGK
jgi:hypothetical protein